MFSHIHIGVADFPRALAFYGPVLERLGLVVKFTEPGRDWAGWMRPGVERPLLLIGVALEGVARPGNGQMVALLAASRTMVDECYALALAGGGVCAGAPWVRPEYHAGYYGAYFRDPDGNKICVCCHGEA